MKIGSLVIALGEPECKTKIDYSCLGVVSAIEKDLVIVDWPFVGKVKFSFTCLESVDS